MSFTVMRHKDGKLVPLKLSIWDAFKGVPGPKPRRPKPCPCCKKIHDEGQKQTNKSDDKNDVKKKKNKQHKGESKVDNNNNTGKETDQAKETKEETETNAKAGRSTRPTETFSAEDDAKIIEMKAAQKSWKEILAAINKESLSQLKEHWKTIDPKTSGKDDDGRTEEASKKDTGNDTVDEPAENEETKIAKSDNKKPDGQAKKQKRKGKQNDGEKDNQNDNGERVQAKENKAKTDNSHNEMRTFANSYDRHKWMAAASKHFDLTGERISPATARKMAEQK